MKVLVIEDNIETTEFIDIAFKTAWPSAEVITAYNGLRGLELVACESPDVVLLDINLPDMLGFKVLKEIRLSSPLPIIVLTVRGSEADIVKGLELGATEYIVKPFGQLELVARIRALLRSIRYSSETNTVIVCGPLKIHPLSQRVTCGSKRIHVTHTEWIILHVLIENADRLVTYSQLAEIIWGDVYPGYESTLRVYLQRLRVKLEGKVVIDTIRGQGCILQR